MSADAILKHAIALHARGLPSQAEPLYREVLRTQPSLFPALIGVAVALDETGRTDEAIEYYERSCQSMPGHALPFTRRAILKVRQSWPAPPPCAACSSGPRIAMTTLGLNGRFGNQLLQYAFLRLYADPRGLEVEVPDWIGRDIFGFANPEPAEPLPVLEEDHFDARAALQGSIGGPTNVDLYGFFALGGAAYAPHKEKFRELFQLSAPARAAVSEPLARLRERGRTVVAVHIRRGDFVGGAHWPAPTAWYTDWLDSEWARFDDPVLYVATDDLSVLADFAQFAPVTASDLWTPVPGVEFLLDFVTLTIADYLAKSNSTFSAVAALLNERAKGFMRPNPELGGLVAYDPWNAPFLLGAFPTPSLQMASGRESPSPNDDKSMRRGVNVEELGRAQDCFRHGQLSEAGRLCSNILRNASVPAEDLVELAEQALDSGEHGLSASLYRRGVTLNPKLAPRALAASYRMAEAGKLPAAVGTLRGILEAEPNHASAEALLSALLSDPSVGFFQFLIARGIDLVVDVGANRGQFALCLRTMGYRAALLSVEPVVSAFAELEYACSNDPLWFAEQCALGSRPGEARIHVAANAAASSSLLPMLPRHWEAAPESKVVGTETVSVVTLDQLLHRHPNLGRRWMLKIDAQGYEKQVLDGLSNLDPVHVIYVELSTVPLYDGQCLMPEMLTYLYERGYVLADVERHMFDPRSRQVLQLNATFLRQDA
ncbi:MAG TPA: FkbM family methyltransferase [Polyangiaceae bacterium]|nr:FkbM family methyltransferase [Polyangiaceae bacterium]HVZ36400.1 FkbM family methyltransferase [Polyangiaceae bacterium]